MAKTKEHMKKKELLANSTIEPKSCYIFAIFTKTFDNFV